MKVSVIALKPLYHPEGGHREVGVRFEISDDDTLKTYEASKLLVRCEPLTTEVDPVELGSDVEDLWDLSLTPKEYLEQFPNGPHADLALRILEREAESETSSGA